MKILLCFILFLPTLAHADFVANAGLEVGELESADTIAKNRPVLKSPALVGFKGEAEFGHPWIGIFGAFHLNTGAMKSQYDYTNEDDASDSATVEDLKTTAIMSRLSLGVRLRLIKFKHFRVFAGGGMETGFLSLSYDKEDFKKKNSNTIGFEESDRATIRGSFAEAGMEIIFDEDSGLRLVAQKSGMNSEKYKTLKDNKLRLNFVSASLSYIQYIDTGTW